LATGCNKSTQIYDVETGVKAHIFSEDSLKDGDLFIRSVCFSPDNKYLAAGAEDKTVKLWDVEQKRLHHTFTGHDLDIYSVDFSKDGSLIVSGSGDKKAKIWSVEKGEVFYYKK
jgi:glucose repression regulatory protein TUP1